MLQAYVDNPGFHGDAVGAGDINLLVDNAHILDEESRRGRLAFAGRTRYLSDYTGSNGVAVDPARVWWGSLQFRVGMTTATIIMWQQLTAGHKHIVTFDGVEVYRTSGATTPAGESTITIDLAGRGYVDNQIVEVEVLRTVPNPNNRCEVRDAYVGPVSSTVPFAWPGAPHFTDTATRAGLKQLSTCGNWLATALLNAREPMPMSVKFLPNLDETGHSFSILAGSISRATNTDHFAITGYIQTPSATQETLRLYLNDVLVASEARARGSYGPFTFDVDTSGFDATARLPWRLEAYTDTQGPEPRGRQLYSVHWGLTYRSAPFANPYPLPPRRAPQQASSVAQWLDDLNRVALHYSDAFNRFAGGTDIFDRVRMFSRRFDSPNLNSDYNNGYFNLRYVPQSWRRGEGVWIKGKDVKLCFGTVTSTPPGKDNKLWSYSAANEVSLTGQDAVETKYIAFDTLSGLNPGDWYYLSGDVRGAFQVWRQ